MQDEKYYEVKITVEIDDEIAHTETYAGQCALGTLVRALDSTTCNRDKIVFKAGMLLKDA